MGERVILTIIELLHNILRGVFMKGLRYPMRHVLQQLWPRKFDCGYQALKKERKGKEK